MLCPPCLAASLRWLDSHPQDVLPDPSRTLRGRVGYDNSTAGARDSRTSRHNRWATLVRESRRAIQQGCAAGNHAKGN